MAREERSTADPVEGDQEPVDAAAVPANDVKARFREALERKNARRHATAAGSGGESKVHSEHGPASRTKQFRRKSGG